MTKNKLAGASREDGQFQSLFWGKRRRITDCDYYTFMRRNIFMEKSYKISHGLLSYSTLTRYAIEGSAIFLIRVKYLFFHFNCLVVFFMYILINRYLRCLTLFFFLLKHIFKRYGLVVLRLPLQLKDNFTKLVYINKCAMR